MSTIKKIGTTVAVVIAILALAAYLLLSNLDDIIKNVIEDVGSEVTQTKVTLRAVKLDLKTGKGKLKGLTIANPPGYDSEYAFSLDNIVVAVSPQSLSKPVIVISRIKIDGASLIAQQKGNRTNLSDLLKNIESGSSKTSQAKKDKPSKPEGGITPRLMVEKFSFTNTRATVLTEAADEKVIEIPPVQRKNIGTTEKGLTPEQLSQELLRAVIKEVEKSVGSYLGKLAAESVEKKLTEKLSDEDKSTVEGLKSLFNKDK